MKFSTASFAFGALLLASLAGKGMTNQAVEAPDYRYFEAQVAAFLHADGYATIVERRPLGPIIYGRKGECRVMVGDYTPYGTFADVFDRIAAPIGPLRFIYRGSAFDEAPKLVPLSEFYVQREIRRIGISVARAPVLAVAASSNCDLHALDWSRFATLPR